MKPSKVFIAILFILSGLVSAKAQRTGAYIDENGNVTIVVPFPEGKVPIRYEDASLERKSGVRVYLMSERWKQYYGKGSKMRYWVNNGKEETIKMDDSGFPIMILTNIDLKKGVDTLHFIVSAEGYKTLKYQLTANSPYDMVIRMDRIDAERKEKSLKRRRSNK